VTGKACDHEPGTSPGIARKPGSDAVAMKRYPGAAIVAGNAAMGWLSAAARQAQ
jgi:hypothetical protein